MKNNEINLSNKVQTKDWNVVSKLGSETLLENKAKTQVPVYPIFMYIRAPKMLDKIDMLQDSLCYSNARLCDHLLPSQYGT